ncbi:hypothetical protein [Marinitoga sp. 1138]|uniref:hypothetical protein n=1 Tax=Marinitoga sp. 1138 TaxID=1643334 RepID=UPI001586E1EC|nr:hypothetical protein [Marinitoga sp. 1138]NUU97615.1 hypothetical protein [Marinitoga sp. 1138]
MKKTIIIVFLVLILIIGLLFKPSKVIISLEFPGFINVEDLKVKVNDKYLTSSKKMEMNLLPGKYNGEIYFKGKIIKNFYIEIPYFNFKCIEKNIVLPKSDFHIELYRSDVDRLSLEFSYKYYQPDFWKISFDNKEYTTTLSNFSLYISPYASGILNAEAIFSGNSAYSKNFKISAPISKIISHEINIDNFTIVSFNLEYNELKPIKFEIYKNGDFFETIENTTFKDITTSKSIKYTIIPVFSGGYKGEQYNIVKPELPEINNYINTKKLSFDFPYKKIYINGKEFSPDLLKEGKNKLKIELLENVFWMVDVYVDTVPPKISDYKIKYANNIYELNLVTNEDAHYMLFTDESTYTFNTNNFEFETESTVATLIAIDKFNNKSKPLSINLDLYPEYKVIDENNFIQIKVEKIGISENPKLVIKDNENNIISLFNLNKISNITFSNFSPEKEYHFVVYIDKQHQKTIYSKTIPPSTPIIKSIKNIGIGQFEITLKNYSKDNNYKIITQNNIYTGKFEGYKYIVNISPQELTNSATMIIWREFKNIKTKEISIKLKDKFMYHKKIYTTVPQTLLESQSPYIFRNDIELNNTIIDGIVKIYLFPDKKVTIKNLNFKTIKSKVIFNALSSKFEGVILKSSELKNVDIYNANIGIFPTTDKFELYNISIKNCITGIYSKGLSTGLLYNILISENKKGLDIINTKIEFKNSLLFDNEVGFNIYNSNVYLYNLSIADSKKADIEIHDSQLLIKFTDFINSKYAIKSFNSNISIIQSMFKDNFKSIKSYKDMKISVINTDFINNIVSLDIYKTPLNIENSEFRNSKRAVFVFDNTLEEKFFILNSTFLQNEYDIYIEGINNIYLKNTEIKNVFDGNKEKSWIDERGKIFQRGKVIMEKEANQ